MLHYEVRGDGDVTLVCLHGFLESMSMWDVLRLEENAKLILIDLPGHGQSGLEGIDSMAEMAELVKEVVSQEDINSYDVVGHSMGGYVALELQNIDTLCQNIVLMNSNVWTDSDQKKEDRQRVAKLVQTKKERFISEAIPNLFQSPENHPEEVESLIQEAIAMKSEAIGRASIAMSQRRDFSEPVISGALSLSVIQGENDPIAPKDRMEQIMTHQMGNFQVVLSGHMAHLEATEEVRGILMELL